MILGTVEYECSNNAAGLRLCRVADIGVGAVKRDSSPTNILGIDCLRKISSIRIIYKVGNVD